MINLRHIEVFYAIMRAGSITEAAPRVLTDFIEHLRAVFP